VYQIAREEPATTDLRYGKESKHGNPSLNANAPTADNSRFPDVTLAVLIRDREALGGVDLTAKNRKRSRSHSPQPREYGQFQAKRKSFLKESFSWR